MANIVHTILGTTAPNIVPPSIDCHYTNTTNGYKYLSTGTSSISDWIQTYPTPEYVLKPNLADQINEEVSSDPRGAFMVGIDRTNLGDYTKMIRNVPSLDYIKNTYEGDAQFLKVVDSSGLEFIYENGGLISDFLAGGGTPNDITNIVGYSPDPVNIQPRVWILRSYKDFNIEYAGGGSNKTASENDAALTALLRAPFWDSPNNTSYNGWVKLRYGEYQFSSVSYSGNPTTEFPNMGVHVGSNAILRITQSGCMFGHVKLDPGAKIVIDSGITCDFGIIEAGSYQIFFGSGSPSIKGLSLTRGALSKQYILPEWFDSPSNLLVDAGNAIEKAINSIDQFAYDVSVLLSSSEYLVNNKNLSFTKGLESRKGVFLRASGTSQLTFSIGGNWRDCTLPSIVSTVRPIINMAAEQKFFISDIYNGLIINGGVFSTVIQYGKLDGDITINPNGGTSSAYYFNGNNSYIATLEVLDAPQIYVNSNGVCWESIDINDSVNAVYDINGSSNYSGNPCTITATSSTFSQFNINGLALGDISFTTMTASDVNITHRKDYTSSPSGTLTIQNVLQSNFKLDKSFSTVSLSQCVQTFFKIKSVQNIQIGIFNTIFGSFGENLLDIDYIRMNSDTCVTVDQSTSANFYNNTYKVKRIDVYNLSTAYFFDPPSYMPLVYHSVYIDSTSNNNMRLFKLKPAVLDNNDAQAEYCDFKYGGNLILEGVIKDSTVICNKIVDETNFTNLGDSCNVNYR